ncbi:unnamed protein product [Pelagomonas calceolata]|uniref:Uncharacterized protein n=1 Tax=Pelagomonas calceolata TaxID=35677 RepID=A0A7S4E380_9STRA|nr:unnamed protein product [Pelagomonas calceolata]
MRSVGLLLCAASVQSFAPPALRSFVRPGEHGCRTTAIRAKENGGGGASELTREGKLIVSILIDLIGMSTYLLPVAGEGADVGWAPVSAALIFWLYGSGIFAAAGFAEEILPGLDFVPTATIASIRAEIIASTATPLTTWLSGDVHTGLVPHPKRRGPADRREGNARGRTEKESRGPPRRRDRCVM